MQVPPQISFHGIEPSAYSEDYIRERIDRLENLHDSIISCRVVVEQPHQNRQTGNPYRCRIELSLPRKGELVASKEEAAERHVELRTVIGRAFDAMEKQLRAATSTHERHALLAAPGSEDQPHGIIVRLFSEDGYGFIKTEDGREFYMHENAVLNDAFDRLQIGAEVRFTAQSGEKGPQASSVQLVATPGTPRATSNPPDLAEPPIGWDMRDGGPPDEDASAPSR
jgi:cold shock CspA family protein/ribosome-associated translation inhibitor RaiA